IYSSRWRPARRRSSSPPRPAHASARRRQGRCGCELQRRGMSTWAASRGQSAAAPPNCNSIATRWTPPPEHRRWIGTFRPLHLARASARRSPRWSGGTSQLSMWPASGTVVAESRGCGRADLNRPRFYAHFLCWKDGAMSIRYDENTKARAVRLVREHRDDYESEGASLKAVSGRLGMNPETLRKWVRQTEIDAGEAPGVSSEERRELRELRRKNSELESNIENLKAATSFFARECDPRHR